MPEGGLPERTYAKVAHAMQIGPEADMAENGRNEGARRECQLKDAESSAHRVTTSSGRQAASNPGALQETRHNVPPTKSTWAHESGCAVQVRSLYPYQL